MTTIQTSTLISLDALPFPAVLRGTPGEYTVEADQPEAALRAAVDAAPPAVDPAVDVTVRRTIHDDLLQGLATMQQIIDAPAVTFTNLAGAQTAMRDVQTAIKAEARQLRRLSRLALGLLDGSD